MAIDTTSSPQLIEHVHRSLDYTPFDARWVPCSARFVGMGITTKAKGKLQVFELERGSLKVVAESEQQHGIKCGTFAASSMYTRHLAFGDHGGGLHIVDLERMDTPVFRAAAHAAIVNAVDGCGGLGIGGGAPELVTAGRDGCVRLWDPRVRDPVLALEPGEGQAVRDCWAVCFGNSYNDEERCIAAGYDNGDVKLFDLRTSALLYETNVGNGVTSLEYDRKDVEANKLAVTTLESRMRVFDLRTQHPEEGFACVTERAHKSTVWLCRHLPQNRDVFMTCGGNGGLNLYKYQYPTARQRQGKDNLPVGVAGSLELLNSRVVSSQPINSFDWSPDREGLAVLTSLDQSLRVLICTRLNRV